MTTLNDVNIAATVTAFAEQFSARLAMLVDAHGGAPPRLEEAVRYSLLGPGKRLRPFLVYECCRIAGGDDKAAFPPAAALEMVHAFSLIHDDLPAMDDDDLRRGRPTCHKQFDEATAVLAGDALLALAFETLATGVADPAVARTLVAELARGSGWRGMIGGQAADLAGEGQPPNLGLVRSIHERKTGALFNAACRMGAIAGEGDAELVARLGGYGAHLGLAFQIVDDLLDVAGTAGNLGKNVGKDAGRGKQTYPASVGTAESAVLAEDAAAAASDALKGLGRTADGLRALAGYVVARRS